MSKIGIDVSEHNGRIDWNKAKSDGVKFAIIRAGIGSDLKSQDDKHVLRNIKECERLHIPYGLYLYSYALSEKDVLSEVKHILRIAKGHNPEMGLWFDMEDADEYKAKHNFNPLSHKGELTQFCRIFLKEVKNAGYSNVGTYANYDYFKNILNFSELKKDGKIWLAHWGIKEPSLECDVWQYTSGGTVAGIAGRVDMNIYYGDLETGDSYYEKPVFTLIDSLNKIGVNSSYLNRRKIAQANGIKNYTGKAVENIYMLELLKDGKLKRI